MIAYFFPPLGGIGAAGSQRTLKFAKYLPQHQWEPIVLTVRESCYESYMELDQTLLKRVPSDIKIIRTPVIRWLTKLVKVKNSLRGYLGGDAQTIFVREPGDENAKPKSWYQRIKDSLTNFWETPDGAIGWLVPAVSAGRRAIQRGEIDVIYSTGKPWTAHLIGLVLKLLTGKPLVADFRDPWMTNPFRAEASALRQAVESFLEALVIKKADLIICNTFALNEEFKERYPKQRKNKFVTLLNGFDPEEYKSGTTVPMNRCERFILTHTGFLYGKRDPRLFCDALDLMLQQAGVDRKKIKVFFVGYVHLAYDLAAYLTSRDLNDVVEIVHHVPYQRSLEYLRNSDALLLLQPGTMTQIPSKLFEYVAMEKPVLAISSRGSATSNLMIEKSLGITAEATDVQDIAAGLRRLYMEWDRDPCTERLNHKAYNSFNVKNVTRRLSRHLDALLLARNVCDMTLNGEHVPLSRRDNL